MPVTVGPDTRQGTSPKTLDVTGPDFGASFSGRGNANDPLGLTNQNALILQSDQGTRSAARSAASSAASKVATVAPATTAAGIGFKPATTVKFYLLPATYLGELPTSRTGALTGTFNGTVPVPAGLTPGTYTLQMNGYSPDGAIRSLSLGVVVTPAVAATKQAKASVGFRPLSSVLTDQGKAALKLLATKAGKNAVGVHAIGYVPPTATDSERTLATQRAKIVATYLRSLGVKGAYVVNGNGLTSQAGATASRVQVTITYRP